MLLRHSKAGTEEFKSRPLLYEPVAVLMESVRATVSAVHLRSCRDGTLDELLK